MELSEMNLEQVAERIKELDMEVRSAQDLDFVKKAKKEKEELLERKAELEILEQRKQDVYNIANGSGKVIEKRKEVEKMEKRTFGIDTLEYRNAFLKYLQGKELGIEERAAVTASAAIPTTTMEQIVGKLELVPLISAVDVSYIPGNVTYPAENSIADASWVAMATSATDSADTLQAVSLAAYKVVKTVEIGADVAAMSIDAFESWLVARLANKLQKAVDNAIINGSGTNEPTGLLKSGEITNTGTFTRAAIKYKDVCNIIAAIGTEYLSNACFIMPRALFFGEILGMETTTGDRVVVADAQSPAKFNILGFPVIVDDNMEADTIVFGDLKAGYKFNFAKMPTVEADSSVGFRTGSVVYRVMALGDGKVADKKALCVYTRASA